jgi:hypothetical protein
MRAAALVLVLAAVVVGVLLLAVVREPVRSPGPAPASTAGITGVVPRAPLTSCHDSITAAGPHDPILADDATDRVVGPVRFTGLRLYEGGWARLVRDDQWIKTIAVLDAGLRVTLEIPRGQRDWIRVDYGGHGGRAVTLRACRRQSTAYAGGFTIDYARAPRQGRCAQVLVWTGHQRAVRARLFPGLCRS